MKFTCHSPLSHTITTDCLIVGVFNDHTLSPSAQVFDDDNQHVIRGILKQRDIQGELGQTLLIPYIPNRPELRVLLVGCGLPNEFTEEAYTSANASAARALASTGARTAHCTLAELTVGTQSLGWKIRQSVVIFEQSFYQIIAFKLNPPPTPLVLQKMSFSILHKTDLKSAEQAILEGKAISEGMNLTRDLSNLPANICTPTYMAEAAKKLAQSFTALKVTILDQAAMEKLNMGALLGVARGSVEPPKLIIVQYQGAKSTEKPIVLVGKGVTFDSGGISIKPAAKMDEMKFDMIGAASILGTLQACASLKLPLNVIGVLACVENLPDGNAYKPGDVLTSMSGQTIEIINTDAEGRLVLCDALTYCRRFKPAVVIDVATLTGSAVIALGEQFAALFTQDETLARDLTAAGESSYDRLWRMPLTKKYGDSLKTPFADIANVGSREGGACVAAAFLARFTDGLCWAHLDIAGVGWRSGEPKGATGRPVTLLTHYLLNSAAAKTS